MHQHVIGSDEPDMMEASLFGLGCAAAVAGPSPINF